MGRRANKKQWTSCWILIAISLIMSGCASNQTWEKREDIAPVFFDFHPGESQPQVIGSVCSIFLEKPHWYLAASKVQEATGAPIPVMMSIIYQESSFKSTVRPLDKKTGVPLSTAYGYAQALEITWDYYQKKTGLRGVKRDKFNDAINFVGWYIATTAQRNQVPMHRADQIYLNYHEGWGGYERGTHKTPDKAWLLEVADIVQKRSQEYSFQLSSCQSKIQSEVANIKILESKVPKPTLVNPGDESDQPPPNRTAPHKVRWF